MRPMTYRNQRQFADALGISQPAVCKLLRHYDCPVRQWAPWTDGDLVTMQRWRATLQEDRSARYLDNGDVQPMSDEEFEAFGAELDEMIDELEGSLDEAMEAMYDEYPELRA